MAYINEGDHRGLAAFIKKREMRKVSSGPDAQKEMWLDR